MIPTAAAVAADVYKAGGHAGHLWRVGATVTFSYVPGYDGAAVAFTLPVGAAPWTGTRLPPFFAGLLPEGPTRRRDLARALHVAEDDELGLLAVIGADTIGDVQVVPTGHVLPPTVVGDQVPFGDLVFSDLWAIPENLLQRSTVPGVQPKLSFQSRSLIHSVASFTILKFSPSDTWRAVLENELTFLRLAERCGLVAARAELVEDSTGASALAVARFDRSVHESRVVRHAQEDATQVLGIYPGEKYDPDARAVITALAAVCAAPKVAARDLLHQLIYSYVVGNNDLHAKNLSVGQDPTTGLWMPTPVYDVLHTWPYEGDHRFHPAVKDNLSDSVTRKHWLALGEDIGVPSRVTERLLRTVEGAVSAWLVGVDASALPMPEKWLGDLRRRIARRLRDVGL